MLGGKQTTGAMGVVTALFFGPFFVIRKIAFTSVLVTLSCFISVSRAFGAARMSYVSGTTVGEPWPTVGVPFD